MKRLLPRGAALVAIGIAVSPPAVAALSCGLFAAACPPHVGTGSLARCPTTRTCVSSLAPDAAHETAPFAFSGPPDAAFEPLLAFARALPGASLAQRRAGYAHVEFASPVMGWGDDVERVAARAEPVVHGRAASRIGRSEFGANRRRVEPLRRMFPNRPAAR